MATMLARSEAQVAPADMNALVRRVTITTLDDIHDAATALADIAAERGLRVAACADISSKEQIVDADGAIVNAEIFGWLADGERWWEDTRLALSSPLPRACRYESEPFWVNADGFRTHWRNKYLEEMSLADFHKRALCKAAIVVPVHLPFGQIGVAAFATTGAEADLSEAFEAQAETLMLLSQRFVSGYVKATRRRRWLPSDCRLTKREVDCLRWAAIGKTDREISLIIGRSHATVRFHIQNAGEKLDAVNRSQAIFKASQLGYLGLAN